MSRYDDYDKYADYEAEFDPMHNNRQARRKRKAKKQHTPKKTVQEQLIEMAGDDFSLDHHGGFNTTYSPSLYEEGWLIESLRSFFEQDLISDVLSLIKGGKEASVYRCAVGPALQGEFVAAKVYRPRQFRSLSNDRMYRDGRELLSSKGEIIDNSDQRTMRAIGKKSAFGQQVEHTSWLMYEYRTLNILHEAGADVPRAIEVNENTILMDYIGDEHQPASTLNKVRLGEDEAEPLFEKAIRNIELMLQRDMIHGDLSPYNILYWQGDIALIDFPQVVNAEGNSQAAFILRRDIDRVCDYFIRQSVECSSADIFNKLWDTYLAPNPLYVLADSWQESDDD